MPASLLYFRKLENISNSSFIVINKQEMVLYHYSYKGDLLQKSPIATGENFGNKNIKGDLKTPEGVFEAVSIEDASGWSHDFKDGNGTIEGAYGPYFIRLAVPGQKGIGIHGTHDNASLGKRASEGCIRMQNENLKQLVRHLAVPVTVLVTPGLPDLLENKKLQDSLKSIP
ncbi:MAG: L,D-transpeptidase [Sphingobacteriales bacterium 41-5]|nr:MAG: L,D-transpeptidase [Sphingobacteriales bacterium 41-5]